MDGKQLKNSILQWAIQGKLVPQNPKDEPAQKLLERIAASRNDGDSRHSERSEESSKGSKKASLRGAKATKQSKALSSRIYRENGVWYEQVGSATPKDISDDIPFEIPENWALCRIKDICSKITDGTHHSPVNTPSGDYKYVTAKNIKDFGIQLSNISYVDKKVHEEIYARCNPSLGDILYIKDGATTGVCCINNLDEPFSLLSSVALLKPQKEIFAPYLLYCLRAPICYDSVRESMKGTGITRITLTKIEKWIIPLPPLAEQKRIVAKLEQVLPLTEEYGAAQEQLNKLNKELPEVLKKSILQEAIQGKLVPQNPKDEPAQKLLEKIALSRHSERSEESSKGSKKASLRGAKATKQSKNAFSRIYREDGIWYEQVGSATPKDISDEIPFEIPESWVWARWGELSDSIQYGYNAPALQSGRIKMVRISDIHDNKIEWSKVPYCQIKESEIPTYLLQKNDILFARTGGTVGKSYLVSDISTEAVYAGYLIRTRYNSELLCPQYLKFFMESSFYWEQLREGTIATAQPNCNGKTLGKMLLPLPPLAEQKRIVAKLEQLFKVL